jgi:hypothetical protein
MTKRDEPYGLAFERAARVEELQQGTVVVLDGRVLDRTADPDDPGRVRLVITPVLGPPPGRDPDRREIVIFAPGDMLFGTARPHNLTDPAPPARE